MGRMERFRAEFRQFFPAALVKTDSSSKYLVDGPWLHPSGHLIDVVVVIDRNGNTLPVPDALVEGLTFSSTTELTLGAMNVSAVLQPDTHAVAVLLLDVYDNTVFTEVVLGDKFNADRDLRAFGFKPCIITHKQFYVEPKARRTEFLNATVSGALEPVME